MKRLVFFLGLNISVLHFFGVQAMSSRLTLSAGGKPYVQDYGGAATGGYATFRVTAFDGAPTLRLSYATHPAGLRPTGDFTREGSVRYLGPTVDLPVLPANLNRHELYPVSRTGRFVAPLIQGLERYVRFAVEGTGSVTVEDFEIVNAKTHSTEPRVGLFACSDARLNPIWEGSVRTIELASIPNHDAWKFVSGRLLPRWLEKAPGTGWSRQAAAADGEAVVTYEFDCNPHFPQGAFEVLAGTRRTRVAQDATTVLKTVRVPVKKGERIGFDLRKESWPVIHSVVLAGEPVPLEEDAWDYARTPPYVSDGAKRDRLVWSGDLWFAQRNVYAAFDPGEPYMKGSLEMLARNQTPEGYVHAAPYPERTDAPGAGEFGHFPSDEFSAWIVPVLADHYLHVGDLGLVRQLFPTVVRLVGYYETGFGEGGLYEQDLKHPNRAMGTCGSVFGDEGKGHAAYVQLMLWRVYSDGAKLAEAVGETARAAAWRAKAETLAQVLRTRFWSEEGLVGSLEKRTVDRPVNALALAFGFFTVDEAKAALGSMKCDNGRCIPHGKFQALAVRGAFVYGDAEKALELVENQNWKLMYDPNWRGVRLATECMLPISDGWGDECHPDTALAGAFTEHVLGVAPTAPGYATFAIRPPRAASLTWAKGVVPTPKGPLQVSWSRSGESWSADVRVPKGLTGAIVFPGRPPRALKAGANKVEGK